MKTWCDPKTGLEWLLNANYFEKLILWEDAVEACKSLGNGWRLPTIQELASLIDYTQHNPALPKGYQFYNVQSTYYWSATTYVANSTYAWCVNMCNGTVCTYYSAHDFYVWPVRDVRGDYKT